MRTIYHRPLLGLLSVPGLTACNVSLQVLCRTLAMPETPQLAEPMLGELAQVHQRNRVVSGFGAVVNNENVGLCGCTLAECPSHCLRKDPRLALRADFPCDGSRYFVAGG